MKRAAIIAFAVAAFAAVLIARLPAAWVLPALRGELRCASVLGTVWQGSCRDIRVQGVTVDRLAWRVRARALLRGRLAVRLSAVRGSASATAEVSWPWRGPIEAHEVFARLPIEPQLLPVVPAYITGTLEAHLERVVVTRDGALTHLRGTVTVLNLVDSSGQVTPLGSFAVTFSGGAGEPVGRLRDLGGPLALSGTVRLTAAPGYSLHAEVAPRASASPSLLSALQFFGAPNAAGQRPFALSGTY